MKTMGNLLSAQAGELLQSHRAAAVALLGVGMSCYYSGSYLQFANKAALAVHPLEAFIINGSCRNSFTCVTLFPLLLLCFDAPYLSDRSPYEIARVGKGRWLRAKLAFLALAAVGYCLYLLAVSAVLTVFSTRSLCWTLWSPAMELLTKLNSVTTGGLYFYFPGLTEGTSPLGAAALTVLLNAAYCLVLCLIITLCNVLGGGARGWIAAAAVHIVNFVMINNGGFLFRLDFSLLEEAFPATSVGGGYGGAAVPCGIFLGLLLALGAGILAARKRLIR